MLVAHDGARWLPDTLSALQEQTRPVDRVIAVDNGSRDRSTAMLVDALGADSVLTLPRKTAYGAAVAEALRHPTAAIPVQWGVATIEWVWLVHDDSAPAAGVLERMLAAADDNRFAGILGPKQRDWLHRRRLVEVGVTIDGAGRRETGLEPREVDQGQHDSTREVLAVSTAGMLVRRDVWDALGGLDPALPLFRDDVDLGWRANAAGHRVIVVPDAVMFHAEASARRRRRIAVASEPPRRLDRRNALFVVLANVPPAAMLLGIVRNFFGAWLRAAVFLLAKQPGDAWDELLAYASVVCRPWRLAKARRTRRRSRRRAYHTLRKLMPPRWHQLRRMYDMLVGFASGEGPVDSAGSHHAAGPIVEQAEPIPVEAGIVRRVLSKPGVLVTLALLLVALIAERGLFGAGRLGGGALLPVWGGASDLWAEYASGWHAVGLGSPASAPPWVAVIAVLATVLLGKTWLAVQVILLGCVPLAGAAAYVAAARLTGSIPVRLWASVTYALLPVATGVVAAGRIGTAVAFILLPLLAVVGVATVREAPRRAMRAAWGAGLLLAVMSAFVPLVWLLALVVGVGAYGWRRGARRGLGRRVLIVLATPLVLMLPWTAWLFEHPSAFVQEAGLARPDLVQPALGPLSILALHPGGPGMPPLWVSVGLVLVALVALVLGRRRGLVVAGWCLTLFGLAVSVLESRLTTSGGEGLPAWPGLPMAIAGAGLVVAVVAGFGRWSRPGKRSGAAALTAVACSTPLLAAGIWSYSSVTGPFDRDNPSVVPAFVAAQGTSHFRARTLVLRRSGDGSVTYAVLRGEGPLLGEAETQAPPRARRHLDGVVAGLASGHGGREASELASYGVGYVIVPMSADGSLLRKLDSVPGISRISVTDEAALWRITRPAARLRIQDGTQTTPLRSGVVGADARIPGGSAGNSSGEDAGRKLVLAEPTDSGWQASLNGRPLRPLVVDGWEQGFALPAGGGDLQLSYDASGRHRWVAIEGLLTFVVLVLALPGGRQEDEEEPPSRRERRRARRGPRRARGHRATKPTPSPTGSHARGASR